MSEIQTMSSIVWIVLSILLKPGIFIGSLIKGQNARLHNEDRGRLKSLCDTTLKNWKFQNWLYFDKPEKVFYEEAG